MAAAVVAIIVVASNTDLHSNSDHKGNGHAAAHTEKQAHKKPRTKAKTYEVQSGDTLTSIAHEFGVPVARILRLNPGVDPQILISGEKLKLR